MALTLLTTLAVAQVHGVPASVTSIGTPGRGMTPGVPASVTSLGPRGWSGSCCRPFPTGPLPLIPSAMGFRDPRFNPDGRAHHLPGSAVFVPYPVGYPVAYPVPVMPVYEEQQQTDDAQAEPEYAPATIFDRRPTRAPRPATVSEPEAAPAPEPAAAPQPEREQEPTLLVFKDGKQLEIRNFAIVGETLYELSPEYRKIALSELDLPATIKVNDDRGVDFHLPAHKGS